MNSWPHGVIIGALFLVHKELLPCYSLVLIGRTFFHIINLLVLVIRWLVSQLVSEFEE